ncbi:TonB-dependent receptor [Gracilimonas mengyeensis]|uniref:Outer membrane receptor for ferrienterochelin and colicins n=1 Tax=Gracilimonas mengyeensis TaxID=1302730 RepID=A0A521FKH1_9BACT|nr:TonB-dependent receptor [Gracilimonas mengyeensis]SMO96534.1 outer membrane receptor for ferrienterochelin and colicins [Gracilimonas mengyeensis]
MRVFLLIIFFCFLPCLLLAQQSSLCGTVHSSRSQPVTGAHIKLFSNTTTLTTVSDADGHYCFKKINSGKYTVLVTSVGYREAREQLELEAQESAKVDFKLKRRMYEEEITVVTASRTIKELEDVSVPVSVIPDSEIEMSGSTRLRDILIEQTGLNVVSDHGNGIQMQGFDPDYTLIMIDNQPVIGRTAGTLDLDRITIGDVQQIEIVKGPSSALWGSDALAGVINIITKKGVQPFKWDMTGRFGSHDSYDGSTNLSFNQEKLSGQFFANTSGSGGYDMDTTSIAPTKPSFQSYTFSGRLNYDLSKKIALGVDSRFYREDVSYPQQLEIDESLYRINGDEYQQNYNITPELSVRLNDRQLFEATAFLSRFESETELNYQEDGSLYNRSTFDQQLNKYELKSSTFWSKTHTTIIGAGLNHEELLGGNYKGTPTFNSYFAFGQHEWELSKQLSFTAGFRFDAHSEYASQFSPKFSGLYRPNDFIHLRASLGGGYKAPEFRQLFLDFTNAQVGYSVFGSSTVVEGVERLQAEGVIEELLINPENIGEIEAERSFAYNVGVDLFPLDGMQLRINAFRNNVQDLIDTQRIAVRQNGQSVFSYFNLNRIYTQGIETELRYRPAFNDNLQLSLGYQYLDARRQITREFDDVVDGRVVTVTKKDYIPMLNRSKHTTNAKIYYTFEEPGIESSLRVQYRGRYWFADYNNNNQAEDNEYALSANTPNSDIDNFWEKAIVNFSLAKTFYDRYRLQAGIDNLTNFQSPQFMPYNPGRTFYAQLNIQLY